MGRCHVTLPQRSGCLPRLPLLRVLLAHERPQLPQRRAGAFEDGMGQSPGTTGEQPGTVGDALCEHVCAAVHPAADTQAAISHPLLCIVQDLSSALQELVDVAAVGQKLLERVRVVLGPLRVLQRPAGCPKVAGHQITLHPVRVVLGDLQSRVAARQRRTSRIEDIHSVEGQMRLLLNQVGQLRHHGAPERMTAAEGTVAWKLASRVAILFQNPLRSAQPAAENHKHIVAQVSATSGIRSTQAREHSLLLVIDKDGDVVARVCDLQPVQISAELGIVASGEGEPDPNSVDARQNPRQLVDGPGVAAAATTASF
mmetsp:Transcript_16709/g.43165  ORF Transcript_16709/g.43165 Transcript_16709/m.43165 type:complete len:313 (+) Transcript_16709:149-1087(+)